MTKKELSASEYNKYYGNYINVVDENTELIQGFEDDKKFVIDFFSSVPENKVLHRYEAEKWTVKEILQHIIDTERIFMYRFLRIARNDKAPLTGFDQNIYIEPSAANNKSIQDLLHEFTVTRLYSLNLLKSIPEKHYTNMGIASDSAISARACAYILLGHSVWHINVIKERYL